MNQDSGFDSAESPQVLLSSHPVAKSQIQVGKRLCVLIEHLQAFVHSIIIKGLWTSLKLLILYEFTMLCVRTLNPNQAFTG